MPEPFRSTGDIPRYDTYPAPSSLEERPSPETAWRGAAGEESARLNGTAKRIGSAVGEAVNTMRRKLQVVPRKLEEAKARIAEAGGDMRDDVSTAAAEWRETAQQRIYQTRMQARRYASEKPFHVLAGAAILGLAVGVGLRIWRWKNE